MVRRFMPDENVQLFMIETRDQAFGDQHLRLTRRDTDGDQFLRR